VNRIKKRGWDTAHLDRVMRLLCDEEPIPRRYVAHPLKGKHKGHWECHIKPDFLLMWYPTDTEIRFVRTGTHADLFGE
jgi:mRNA interferase YafQ